VDERRAPVSDAERDVLKVLWEHGPGTVRQINQALRKQRRRWAYTTVITLLGRLESKGYVTSDKSGFAHVFAAAVSRDQVVQQRLADLAAEFCEGESAPLVLALVQDARFTDDEIERFQQMIDELAAKRNRKNR
jgi:BlaI family transcriptional regulator, penicillinase repressor